METGASVVPDDGLGDLGLGQVKPVQKTMCIFALTRVNPRVCALDLCIIICSTARLSAYKYAKKRANA